MSNQTSEYQSISTNFTKMMAGNCKTIVKIERIQNQRCYKQYAIHREDFLKRLNSDTEKLLYHGCPEEAANSITEGFFNRSFAGKNGKSKTGFAADHRFGCTGVMLCRCRVWPGCLLFIECSLQSHLCDAECERWTVHFRFTRTDRKDDGWK